MNYLLTGATGFIGKKLTSQLLARDSSSVHYLARGRSSEISERAVFHSWTTDQKPDLTGVPTPAVVFHLVGEPVSQRWTKSVKQRIYDSRVLGTRNLVAALAGLGKRDITLVSASAVGYYGDRGDEILTEQSSHGNDFLARVCEDWEREALAARDLGFRVVPIRISVVLGPDGGALPKMLPLFRLGLGAKFGSGRQWMSWIQVDDLIRLFLFAADNPAINGALNGSSPEPVTNQEFTKQLAKAMHRPAVLSAPKAAMKLVMGEMAAFLFSSLRTVPEAARNAGFQFEHTELTSALKAALPKV